jgi:hypothetical protein
VTSARATTARLSLHPDGSVHPLHAPAIAGGSAARVRAVLADGRAPVLEARFAPFDHVPGGIVDLALPLDAEVVALEVVDQ